MDKDNKKITSGILEKDHIFNGFVKIKDGKTQPITLDDLNASVSSINLIQNVPREVKEVFEISKRLFIFGYFYYRFFTVSQHYAFLALESALKNKYKQLFSCNEQSLKKVIDDLTEKGVILKKEKALYDAGRYLRNTLSHLVSPPVLTPSVGILERVAEQINKIYIDNKRRM